MEGRCSENELTNRSRQSNGRFFLFCFFKRKDQGGFSQRLRELWEARARGQERAWEEEEVASPTKEHITACCSCVDGESETSQVILFSSSERRMDAEADGEGEFGECGGRLAEAFLLLLFPLIYCQSNDILELNFLLSLTYQHSCSFILRSLYNPSFLSGLIS